MPVSATILSQLSPSILVESYTRGLFPMVEGPCVRWYSPPLRGVLPLNQRFHVSRRLGQTVRSGRFACTIDRAFRQVICACADRPEGTWISPEMHCAYVQLHWLGIAHSVEAWPTGRVGSGRPVGGLYGVAIGGAFFAESMFHTATDAGKVALVYLVDHLRAHGYALLDVQWTTDHLNTFGAIDVPREQYLAELRRAVSAPGAVSAW